jgi:FkbM family methyltransferase
MFAKLEERYAGNKEVILRNVGLSDQNTVIQNCTVLECWTIGQPGLGGLSVSPGFREEKPFDMVCRRLDDDLETLGITNVGIIKLDVDGYELRVLRGAEKTIRRDTPPILCELGCYLERIGDDPKTFINFIFSLGYKIVSMDLKSEYFTWEQIAPEYPHNTTFDVMLFPK